MGIVESSKQGNLSQVAQGCDCGKKTRPFLFNSLVFGSCSTLSRVSTALAQHLPNLATPAEYLYHGSDGYICA
ncbi:hypothetical protein KC320_g128 [Hortaea werneckii]|nr:hypothetical protein KC320_g128 [Hortaea werneckii]